MTVAVKRTDGSTIEVEMTPAQADLKNAIVDVGDETIYLVHDAGAWREMTDQEVEQQRRAWEADMKDIERSKWR